MYVKDSRYFCIYMWMAFGKLYLIKFTNRVWCTFVIQVNNVIWVQSIPYYQQVGFFYGKFEVFQKYWGKCGVEFVFLIRRKVIKPSYE